MNWKSFKVILIIISFLSSVFVLSHQVDMLIGYDMLVLLPVVYAISIVLAKNFVTQFGDSIVYTIGVAGGFMRMSILPIVITLAHGDIFFGFYETTLSVSRCLEYMPYALLLMCFEQCILMYALEKYADNNSINRVIASNYTKKNSIGTFVFWMLLAVMLGYVIFMGNRYPTLFNYLNLAWSFNDLIGDNIVQGNPPSSYYRLFLWFVDMLQLLIPVLLVTSIKQKTISDNTKKVLYTLVALCSLCVMTDDKVLSILYAVLIILWVKHEFTSLPRSLYMLLAFVLSFGLLALAIKSMAILSSSDADWYLFSGTLNAYFNGPSNIAAGLVMNNQFEGSVLRVAMNDLFNSIPFMPVLYKDHYTIAVVFNDCVKGQGAIVTKVIPMISQGAFYLTPFLAPLLDIIMIKIAYRIERKYQMARDTAAQLVLMFMTIFISFTPIMYNANIMMKNTYNMFFVLWLINLRNKRYV